MKNKGQFYDWNLRIIIDNSSQYHNTKYLYNVYARPPYMYN